MTDTLKQFILSHRREDGFIEGLLSSSAVSTAVACVALDLYGGCLTETLPAEQINKYRLLPLEQAVEQIHFPKDEDEIRAAGSGAEIWMHLPLAPGYWLTVAAQKPWRKLQLEKL